MKNIILIIFFVLTASIIVFLGIGWIRNLVKFVQLDFQSPYKSEVIRGIGITPIGAIIGWVKLEDK